MNLIIQISNNIVTEKLRDFGLILYELKSLDAVILNVDFEQDLKIIENIPGVISVKKEAEGCLMV